MLNLSTDIQYLKGVGEKRAILLKQKGIDTVGALLTYFPRAYLNWQDTKNIADCPFSQNCCIRAKIVTPVEKINNRKGIAIYKFLIEDSSDRAMVTLFNQQYLAESLRVGNEYLFYGKLDGSYFMRELSSPVIRDGNLEGIEPIYPAGEKLSTKTISKLVKTALNSVTPPPDILSDSIKQRLGLVDYLYALQNIHFPKNAEALEKAKKRLVFDELFTLQVGLGFLKKRKRGIAGCKITKNYLNEFKNNLSFSLTTAQEKVINECIADMSSKSPMNRLIQGDVGSGKTAVAAALCYISAKNGFQSTFMAPTEILAEQHYKTLLAITANSGIVCALLTGSMTKKQKENVKQKLKEGKIDVLIGTHALITDDVDFNRLGLVITDEQHRFGVAQRGKLASKGQNPHTLVMSATPIPRTLGLIIYGDLDISIIDEYPKGRQKIDTFYVDSSYRERIYNYIKKFLKEGRQAYIVCPLVEDNLELPVTSAEEFYKKLKDNEFKDYNVGLLHGKMNGKDKDAVMRSFSVGEIDLLIATTVIEVGIDVPNAVVMVIENAERFGLSQLHQLRGRIGRGSYKSSCILISDSKFEGTKKRLNIIKNTSDGFLIADEDLKLRGPGDFLGRRQHGLPEMKLADIFTDRSVLLKAKEESENLLKVDGELKNAENLNLRNAIMELYKKLNQN